MCSELKDAVEQLVRLTVLSQQLAASENGQHDVPPAPATTDDNPSVGQPSASTCASAEGPAIVDENGEIPEELMLQPVDPMETPIPAPVNYAPGAGRIFAGLRAVQVVLNTAQVRSRQRHWQPCLLLRHCLAVLC